jgi:hypothetical protein
MNSTTIITSQQKIFRLTQIRSTIAQKKNSSTLISRGTSREEMNIKHIAALEIEYEYDKILRSFSFQEVVEFYDHTTKFKSSLSASAVEILFENMKDRRKMKENLKYYQKLICAKSWKLALIKTYLEYHKYISATEYRMQNIYKKNILKLCSIYIRPLALNNLIPQAQVVQC